MPLNLVTGLFQRARAFVDTFAAGDEITREDLDIECNDLAAGINAALTNSLNILGEWAAVGAFPTARPDDAPIRARDTWRVTISGTVGGVEFVVDDYLVAMQADPGTTYLGNWMRIPNLFLPAVLATLAAAEGEAAAAAAAALAAGDSQDAAAASASSAFGSATSAEESLNQTLALVDSLPEWRGSWTTGVSYGLGDLVQTGGSSYICVTPHTSDDFATDLAALRWALFAAQGAPGAGTGDLLAAQNLNDLSDKPTARVNLGTIHYVAAASAPSSPAARMLWRDTSVSPSRLYLRNDANDAWLDFDPIFAGVLGSTAPLVASFDAHVKAGTFRTNSGATGTPLAGEGFRGTYWPGADATSGTQIAMGETSRRIFARNRASGVWGGWNEFLTLANGGQIAAGITAVTDDDGTFSSGTYTPTPVGGNFKTIANAGAFTFAAPTASGVYTLLIEVTNASGAGAITMSGFAKVNGVFTTTVGHRFQVVIAKTQNGVTATIQAMQ